MRTELNLRARQAYLRGVQPRGTWLADRDAWPHKVQPGVIPAGLALLAVLIAAARAYAFGRSARPPPDTHVRAEQKAANCSLFRWLSPAAQRAIGVPLCRADQTTHSLHQPPWAGTAMEEFLAAVLARAACLLAGAQIVPLIRAFLATLSPARP
jgi:hypothetical protein